MTELQFFIAAAAVLAALYKLCRIQAQRRIENRRNWEALLVAKAYRRQCEKEWDLAFDQLKRKPKSIEALLAEDNAAKAMSKAGDDLIASWALCKGECPHDLKEKYDSTRKTYRANP